MAKFKIDDLISHRLKPEIIYRITSITSGDYTFCRPNGAYNDYIMPIEAVDHFYELYEKPKRFPNWKRIK